MERKVEFHIYTVADFIEEEVYLRRMSNEGWRLSRAVAPGLFFFEKAAPEDVIYKLDFQNNAEGSDYRQMFEDYGWEYCTRCAGWLYFRKNADDAKNDSEAEIFSDNASKITMLEHILKMRIVPLLIIFLCCVVPNTMRIGEEGFGVLGAFFGVMFVIYVYLLVHCSVKIKKMKSELE